MVRFSLLLVNLVMLAFATWIVVAVAQRDSILVQIALLAYFLGIVTVGVECMIEKDTHARLTATRVAGVMQVVTTLCTGLYLMLPL